MVLPRDTPQPAGPPQASLVRGLGEGGAVSQHSSRAESSPLCTWHCGSGGHGPAPHPPKLGRIEGSGPHPFFWGEGNFDLGGGEKWLLD